MVTPRSPSPKRQILSLVMTERCNLRCTYCYETKSNSPGIAFETAQRAILNAFQNPAFDELEIDFFGGEPFIEYNTLRNICSWLWSEPRPKPYICFAVTNGTLVHGGIRDWVLENKDRIILGLSLDGTPEMHNTNRGNSYSSIDIDFFRTTWPLQAVKMTVSRDTLPTLADGIIYLHELGFMVICTYAFGAKWQPIDSEIFSIELKRVADYYIQNPSIEPCNIVMMAIDHIFDAPRDNNYCGAGKNIWCVDKDGVPYPCQTFLPMSTGKSRDEMLEVFQELKDGTNNRLGKCQDCALLPICQTCYGINYTEHGNPFIRSDQNCEFSKIRAKATSYMLSQMILHRGRDYKCLQSKSDSDLYHIIRGIRAVQDNFA